MTERQQQYRDEYLRSEHWQLTRAAALARAENRCQVCNASSRLDVHHRTYERLGNEHPGDLTVLCRRCHDLFHDQKSGQKKTKTQAAKTRPRIGSDELLEAIASCQGRCTTEALMWRTGCSKSLVAARLDVLRRQGLVRRTGPKKKREWSLKVPSPASNGSARSSSQPSPGLVRRWIEEDALEQLRQHPPTWRPTR